MSRNHWWSVPFHLTGRGITTRPMGDELSYTIDFDFVDHRLLVYTLAGETMSFPLAGQSMASFWRRLFGALEALGVEVDIDKPSPFDLPDADRPFVEDTEHAAYGPRWVTLLAGAQPGQPRARTLRCRLLGEGEPRPPFLAYLRHRRHPLF